MLTTPPSVHRLVDGVDEAHRVAAAVTETFDQLAEAWDHADGTMFGKFFEEHADFIDIRGEHHHGRDAIAHGHQAIFDSVYAGSTVRFDVDAVHRLGPGRAIALIAATMEAPTGPLAGTNHSRITAVLTQFDDGWKITSFHNTLIQAAAPPS